MKLMVNMKYPIQFKVLLIVSFFSVWGYGAQRVLAPVQMKLTGEDIFHIGLYLSFFGVPRALMNIVGGHLSDRFSKKYNMIFSILLFGFVSSIAIGLSKTSLSIGLWRIIMAIGLSWGTTAMLAYLSGITMTNIRGTAFGLQKMATWTGLALASFISPILLPKIGMFQLMMVMSFLALTSVILVYFFLHDVEEEKGNIENKSINENSQREHLQLSAKIRCRRWEKVLLSVSGFLMKIIEDGVITFFLPIFLLIQFQDFVSIGLLISLYTAVYVISQPIGGILADLFGSLKVIAAGLIFNIAAILVLGFSQNETLLPFYVVAIIAGIGSGMVVTSAEMRASMIGLNGEKSKTLGYWRFYRDLGSFMGPLYIGLVLTLGDELLFIHSFALLLIIVFLLTVLTIFAFSRTSSSAV